MIFKKKVLIGIIIILLLLGASYVLFRPLPLEDIVSDTANLNIGFTVNEVNQDTTLYQFASDSNELKQILQILHRYSYHRNLRSWSNNPSIGGNVWLNLYSGESNILLGGGKEIIVNNRIYQLGYWGSQKSLSLMEEILSVIRNE